MTDPVFIKPADLHPLSASLLAKPKDERSGLTFIPPVIREGATDYDTVAGGVADLQNMFAASITPTECDWASGKVPSTDLHPEPRPPAAPPKFRNAYHSIIDALLVDPSVTVTRLSTLTGYSRTWLHKVMSSDSFQAQLSSRQKNCVDDHIRVAVMDRIAGLGSRALELLETAMDSDKVPAAFALEIAQFATKAQGIGQAKAPVVTTFLVQVPVQINNAVDWAAQHAPGGALATSAQPLDLGPAEIVENVAGNGTTDGAQSVCGDTHGVAGDLKSALRDTCAEGGEAAED